jgi:sugar O-acyltransferase (sialic acid O-acetyltransferase NeuD family)
MSESLILFPFGGNAREASVAIEALNAFAPRYRILGYLDDNCDGLQGADYPILGATETWQSHRGQARLLAVPGSPVSFRQRRQLIERFGLRLEDMVSIVDPSVRVASSAGVGTNTLVMAGCFLSSGVRIGDHCVVLPNTVISHDTRLHDYAVVGSNVSLSGGVVLGENCYIGSGTRIREGVSVGAGALVGIGAVVLRDVAPGAVVAGVPARELGEG